MLPFYDYNTECLCSKNNAKLKTPFLGKVNISTLCNIDFNRKIISLNGLSAQPSSNMVSRKVRNRITIPGSKTKTACRNSKIDQEFYAESHENVSVAGAIRE